MTNIFIDNYDSFSYILIDYLKKSGMGNILIYRNDAISAEEIIQLQPNSIIISPGPSSPNESGICLELISMIIKRKIKIPLLGVCLGHQAIIQACGGQVVPATPVHGKQDLIIHQNSELFTDIPTEFHVARYHSLVGLISEDDSDLKVTAKTKDSVIMAVNHKFLPIYGVQFHPESVVTQFGTQIIKNFIKIINSEIHVGNSKPH